MTERDWYAWHHDYDDPATALARRLAAVQEQICVALDQARPGPLRAISLCAGQGRDLIGALAGHPRQRDVRARLVELDPRNADVARQAAQAAGLSRVEVVTDDAALTDAYAGMTPADLVLVCGVFGNMTDADVERTVGYCTQLCARDGTVVWTRGRWPPDLVPQICDWFAGRGFDELWVSDPAEGWGAAAHRFTGTPDPLEPGVRMFTFRGHHPGTGPPRHLSLSTERIVVPAPPPVPARGGRCLPTEEPLALCHRRRLSQDLTGRRQRLGSSFDLPPRHRDVGLSAPERALRSFRLNHGAGHAKDDPPLRTGT